MEPKTFFAPELTIENGTMDVDFYKKAFGAVEIRRFSNDDGSMHVSELEIDGALFHLHEVTSLYSSSPLRLAGTTVTIGLFVEDVDAVIASAIGAGATLKSPAQDYFYGYRQGQIVDPHGHRWQIQKRIPQTRQTDGNS
jgi:PhnB protein